VNLSDTADNLALLESLENTAVFNPEDFRKQLSTDVGGDRAKNIQSLVRMANKMYEGYDKDLQQIKGYGKSKNLKKAEQ
jgi:hypothetical protein